MKIFIAFFALVSSYAFACSAPLPATAQLSSINLVLNSEAFKSEMSAAQGRDYSVSIKKIDTFGTQVSLSNGCTIKSVTTYRPVSKPGMCPTVDRVISETVCK
jgi:hypothetical protein